MLRPAFSELIYSSGAYKILQNDILNGQISHAYIFVSQDRLTLSVLSSLFAAQVLCGGDSNKEDLVFSNKHADFIKIPSCDDKGVQKTTVLTADIDSVLEKLYLKPVYGKKKFYVIDYGETMNASCQNKLLKSLEEPPPSVHFIINTTSYSAMLSTVLSRCKQITPNFYSAEEIKKALLTAYPHNENIDLVMSACGGNLERAQNMAVDRKFAAMFSTALSSLLNLQTSKNILFCSAQVLNYKDKLANIFEFYELIFRDVIIYHSAKAGLLMLKSNESDIQKLAKMYSLDACVNIMPQIAKANKRLKSHGNLNSIVDELLFMIAEIKAKYK